MHQMSPVRLEPKKIYESAFQVTYCDILLRNKRHLKRNITYNVSTYSRIYVAMLGGMSCIRFPDRYNAVYDHEIFHEMMIKAVTTDSNLT